MVQVHGGEPSRAIIVLPSIFYLKKPRALASPQLFENTNEKVMFTSTGILHYDPGLGSKQYDPHWAILMCDDSISQYYCWLLKKHGVETYPNDKGLWGTHVSVLKGDPPPNPQAWGKYQGFEVEFYYNHLIRYDNGKHAWVDVYSEDLSYIRRELGFDQKPWYHLTVGRLVRPFEVDFTKYGIT